ncbi:LysR family transcriptional regulator [Natronosporangium hydrolyticum]|uniref:LysR family transcriptional regulator n=1 Tax=Natronosporangium hydrolyticum TaxID=2811111 RepID=A0A895Y9G4_9ACTN|nr:LysR family transcriptional regulator [Natronosporangium hydrolyticum]QSB13961.1 LysR family transcriptional regulator [Natronosporangium hydrolyticum]
MLDVRRLRLLRDLANLGTIAAVAEAHTYTASAVSQQLAALQRQTGVALLEHTGRRVTLTPAGRELVAHTETVLAALEAAAAAVAAARAGLSGTIRLGAFPSAVRTMLPAALVALGRDNPGLDLMVTEIDPVAVPEALRTRRLDVALWHDYDVVPAPPDPALESVPLLDEAVYLAAPAALDAADADPVAAARHCDWILGTPGTLCHTVAVRVCEARGFAPRARHHVDDFDAALTLVAAGQGVTLVPLLGAGQPPPRVRLLPLATHRRTRIGYRRGAGDHPAVAACVDALRSIVESLESATPTVLA